MSWQSRITIDPKILVGKPVIIESRTRIPSGFINAYFAFPPHLRPMSLMWLLQRLIARWIGQVISRSLKMIAYASCRCQSDGTKWQWPKPLKLLRPCTER